MNHRIGQFLFAAVVGLLVAWWSYTWITDPSGRAERRVQEQVVLQARTTLMAITENNQLDIVDPLAPQRKVGKVYVYRSGNGRDWEVSGFFRRSANADWHPFLLHLAADGTLLHLKTSDPALRRAAAEDARLTISR